MTLIFLDKFLKEFTNCTDTMADGNLFSWLKSDPSWNNSYSLDTADFCKSKILGIKVLPVLASFNATKDICAKMQGHVYTYESSLNNTEMVLNIENTAFYEKSHFWCGYTDMKSADVFVSADGKENLKNVPGLQWSWGQPNGGTLENCTVLGNPYTNHVIDYSCNAQAYVTCHFPSNPKFHFRGINSLGLDPRDYFLLQLGEDLDSMEYYMKSALGAVIKKTKENSWSLSEGDKVLATQNSSNFFLSVLTHGEVEKIMLKLI